MSLPVLVTFLGYFEIVLCLAAFGFIVLRKQWRDYWAIGSFLAVRAVTSTFLTFLVHSFGHFDKVTAYSLYFYVYWLSFAVEAVLGLFVLYGVFRLATTPLRGLQWLGMMVFGFLAAISVLLAFGSAFAPGVAGPRYIMGTVAQLQQVQSILTLGLMLFIFLAIRPMGLSYRSKVFGVSLGLAIMAILNLVQSAWSSHNIRMRPVFNVVNGVVVCATLAIWAGYFAMREPERREVMLPAGSVFVRLNRMGLGWFG